jgi:hypothetical protein
MTATANLTTESAASIALASLPIALQDEARAVAWEMFQQEGRDLGEATIQACRDILDILEYEIAWDLEVAGPVLELVMPEVPAPPASPAARKAAYQLGQGVQIVAHAGGFLVPSGTRGGVVHYVRDGVCSCEAAQKGRGCWHVEAVTQIAGPLAA